MSVGRERRFSEEGGGGGEGRGRGEEGGGILIKRTHQVVQLHYKDKYTSKHSKCISEIYTDWTWLIYYVEY